MKNPAYPIVPLPLRLAAAALAGVAVTTGCVASRHTSRPSTPTAAPDASISPSNFASPASFHSPASADLVQFNEKSTSDAGSEASTRRAVGPNTNRQREGLLPTAHAAHLDAARPELATRRSHAVDRPVPPPLPLAEAAEVRAPTSQPSVRPVVLAAMQTTGPAELPREASPEAALESAAIESPREVPGSDSPAVPIDLTTALAIAAGENPQIGLAQQRIRQAYAQFAAAQVLWIPSLRAGANYNKHEGQIQDVVGQVIETSRGSVYTGFGAMAVGAGSPAVPGLLMNFHLRDAIYQPRIAVHQLNARRFASAAVRNDVLLETALAYVDLLEAAELAAVSDQTRANAQNLVDLTEAFARAGQGLQADADRARTELAARDIDRLRAAELVRVASVRLARQLSHDPTQLFVPQEPALVPIDLVPHAQLQELIAEGLSTRPELAESQMLVCEAVQRLRREQHSVLVPSVLMGVSYGGNGGGVGSDIVNFGDRLDFDAAAFWEARNLGLGDQAARAAARAGVEQARWQQVQVMDRVAAEVVEAHAQVETRRQQIELAQQAIQSARDSYRRNIERIRDAQGLPIESLQSLQALDQAQRQYVRAVADYNRAQFRLHHAIGWPIDGEA